MECLKGTEAWFHSEEGLTIKCHGTNRKAMGHGVTEPLLFLKFPNRIGKRAASRDDQAGMLG
jgi:hypothetical protein